MIREKKIKSGKLLEIEFFPVYNNGARIPARSQKEKISKEKQKKLNKKNAEKKLIRKVNANFDEGDLFCHFTYKADNIPQSETQLKKDIKNYIRRLKNYRQKNNMPEIKYLYVIEKSEYQTGKNKGKANWHVHMFMSRMDRTVAENLWLSGTANCDRYQPRSFGPKAAAKYIAKSPEGKKRFSGSRNLKKPVELKPQDGKTSRAVVERMATVRVDDSGYWERRYRGYDLLECTPVFNEYNLHWYVSVTMYKKENEKNAKEATRGKRTNQIV